MQQLPPILPPPALSDGNEAPPRSAERHANLVRFQSELEFVQCLSSPAYLHELSQQGYLSQATFINYLKYLNYWREPHYTRFIVYPTCLVYLSLLQTPSFRNRLSDQAFIADLIRVGIKHHETWRVEKPAPTSTNSISQMTSNVNGRATETREGDDDNEDDDDDESRVPKLAETSQKNGKKKRQNRKSDQGLGSRDGLPTIPLGSSPAGAGVEGGMPISDP